MFSTNARTGTLNRWSMRTPRTTSAVAKGDGVVTTTAPARGTLVYL